MRGHDQIITILNDVLTAELTAVKQYFIHARMSENWGYERLWKKVREESIGEMRDADKLIGRILYFEGIPNLRGWARSRSGKRASPSACRTEVNPCTSVQSQVFEGEPRA